MCVVNVWFIISICKNELIFYANLFVTILSCFKKHNFSQQKILLLEHLEFFCRCVLTCFHSHVSSFEFIRYLISCICLIFLKLHILFWVDNLIFTCGLLQTFEILLFLHFT